MILAALFLRSQDIRPIAWCVVGLCAGIYLFFNGFRLLRRRQLILNTPISKIRSASIGIVELSGLAVGPYTVSAPITERPCYYYRTLVWEWKRQGRSSQWVKVAAECMHVPFFLDDNTGKVMVDPRSADLDLHRDFQQEFCDSFFTTKEEVPPNVRTLLSRHGVNTTNKIKVEEFCIKPKNALFLLGTLDENPGLELTPQPIPDDEHNTLAIGKALWSNPLSDGLGRTALSFVSGDGNGFSGLSLAGGLQHDPKFDSTYEQALSAASSRVVRLSPDPASTKTADMTQQQRIAAALLQAGISNPAAWAAAGVTTSGTAAKDPTSSTPGTSPAADFDPHPPVVLMKGKNNPTFLISWRSQREIARSLGWKCTLMIWGGPALSLLCLYGLLFLTHSL
ncbi:MAG: hypothetical protein ABSB39_23180 [Candidatus Sulfotelmatobacter sp.]